MMTLYTCMKIHVYMYVYIYVFMCIVYTARYTVYCAI